MERCGARLLAVIEAAIADGSEGLAVLRCRDGLRHGVWVQRGFVTGAHVAGEFDPLLARLYRSGALDRRTFRASLDSLRQSDDRRAGLLAIELGVDRARVRDALAEQLVDRARTLFALAETRGHDAAFEVRPVPEREWSVRMPLGSLLRRLERTAEDPRSEQRKRLRALARALHPDLHAQRGPAAQRACEEQLASATAAYHGFTRVA